MTPGPSPAPKFAMSIDGKLLGMDHASGGYPKGEVVTMFPGQGGPPRRQLSAVRYTNLRIGLGLNVGASVLAWVNAALANAAPVIKNGTLIELDPDNRAASYLDFSKGSVAEFVFPGLDGASKAPCTTVLEVAMDKSVLRPGDGARIVLPRRQDGVSSNFRLTIDGLPTSRVRSIAPISFRRNTGGVAGSDLVVLIADADAAPWRAWADDFIVKGNNGQDKEKRGKIEVLAPNMSDVLATLTIGNIGIAELGPSYTPTRSQQATMYFEVAQLSYP